MPRQLRPRLDRAEYATGASARHAIVVVFYDEDEPYTIVDGVRVPYVEAAPPTVDLRRVVYGRGADPRDL